MIDLLYCKNEGAEAFRTYGVNGLTKNPYSLVGMEVHKYLAFREGFSEEHFAACLAALQEAAAYHALSLRDNVTDRAWAAKLADTELPHGAELTKEEAERRNAVVTWIFEGGTAHAMTEAQARMFVAEEIAGKVGALVRIVG